MKIVICCDEEHFQRFLGMGERLGHTVHCTGIHPSAEEVAAFCPDGVLLQVRGSASDMQDLLIEIYEICASPPRLMLFECRQDGRCFCVETRAGDDQLQTLIGGAMGQERITLLRYPDQNWQERFPGAFSHPQRRETTKTMLYGITGEEFEEARQRYRLHLNRSDFYLFMWELNKTGMVDYPVNKSVHYYLHALRMEDFERVLAAHGGGEIVFQDISFAYIIVNASRSNSARARKSYLDRLVCDLAGVSGYRASHCFISSLLHTPEEIYQGHQEFKRTCAYRFFCREATALSVSYIKAHRRWFAMDEIYRTIDTIQHCLSFDLGSPELPALIRKLYLEIIKPSMSYKLYYLASEAILKTLKKELSVKLLLDAIDSPWLVLTSQFGTIEESCVRVLECVDTLIKCQVKTHNIGNLAVRQALQYIEENYAQPLTVTEIARCFNVSPSYLSQCFKQETGVSIKRYLIIRRMQQAKHLLLTTDQPVGTVALAVGYDDYRQFSKMFKSCTGVTPVQCRKGVMTQLADKITGDHFSLEM